jgi:hypothetical protein
MEQNSAGLEASAATKGFRYAQHRPEQTLLYQLVERYYPELAELMADQGRSLPRYVCREFDEYLKCGRLEYGILRLRCDACHAERLLAFSCTNSRRFRRAAWLLSQLRRETYGR